MTGSAQMAKPQTADIIYLLSTGTTERPKKDSDGSRAWSSDGGAALQEKMCH